MEEDEDPEERDDVSCGQRADGFLFESSLDNGK